MVQDGVFHLTLPVNSIITITSSLNSGMHGSHSAPPEPQPFPFPYHENFDGEPETSSYHQLTVVDSSIVEYRAV